MLDKFGLQENVCIHVYPFGCSVVCKCSNMCSRFVFKFYFFSTLKLHS